MSKWIPYPDLSNVLRLKEEGRELLGQNVYFTVKRDGENVSIWLDENNEPHISSHHQEGAHPSIMGRLKQTPEYEKIVNFLREHKAEYGGDFIVYGELLKTVSPTRIERNKKNVHWVLFDIYDVNAQSFLPYPVVYQSGYHYKIPVVDLLREETITSLDELAGICSSLLSWCKHHRREGIVLKCYKDFFGKQTFAKEKIDLPKRIKVHRLQKLKIELPLMPEDRILRALQHAYDEIYNMGDPEFVEERWKNPKVTMPIIARHLAAEANEHNFAVPKAMFAIYQTTPIEKVKPNVNQSKSELSV